MPKASRDGKQTGADASRLSAMRQKPGASGINRMGPPALPGVLCNRDGATEMTWGEGLTPPYSTIVVDPPWKVRQPPKEFGTGHLNQPLPYKTMTVSEIRALPVADLAAGYCHIYLWTVNKHLRAAFDVLDAWGFHGYSGPKALVWCKEPQGVGPGREFASTTEFVLFSRRGTRVEREPERIPTNWWVWPRRKHSVKPHEFYDLVERVSPGPYLDLFARRARSGWDVWGDEIEPDLFTEVS